MRNICGFLIIAGLGKFAVLKAGKLEWPPHEPEFSGNICGFLIIAGLGVCRAEKPANSNGRRTNPNLCVIYAAFLLSPDSEFAVLKAGKLEWPPHEPEFVRNICGHYVSRLL